MRSGFQGFPPEAMAFFRGLARHNDREWFQPRKPLFEQHVKQPMRELVEALNGAMKSFAPEYSTDPDKAIYRIYRDTRFSKDKTPYKTHVAASFHRRGTGPHKYGGYYLQVSHKEVAVGGGGDMPEPPVLLEIRRIGGTEAFRNTRQLLALDFSQQLPHRPRSQDLAEFGGVFGNVPADFEQHRRLRHVHPAAPRDLFGRNLQVIAAVLMRPGAAAVKAGGYVGLVRRLILAEARVAVDAVDGLVGIGRVLRSKAFHRAVQRLHQFAHRLLDVLLEERLAWLKPLAVVVAREATEEGHGLWRKSLKSRSHVVPLL